MTDDRISISDVFSQSFTIWKQNAVTILSIGLIVYLPAQILIEIVSILSDRFFPVTDLNSLKIINQVYDLIRYLVGAIALIGIVFLSYSRVKDPARQLGVVELIRYGLLHWGKYMLTGLLAGLKTILYLLLLIVPGIIKGVKLSMFDCIVATQETTPEGACERSEQLLKGKWWLVFGFTILVLVIEFVFEIIVAFLFFSSVESNIPSILIGVAIKLFETYFIVSKAVLFVELENRAALGAV